MKALRHLVAAVRAAPPVKAAAGAVPHLDLNSLLDSYYEYRGNRPADKSRSGYFHPSSGLVEETEGCLRAVLFSLLQADTSPTQTHGGMFKVWENGSNRHVGLQSTLHQLASEGFGGIVRFAAEVKLTHPFWPITGHADGIIQTSRGHRYLIDIKTKRSDLCDVLLTPEPPHVLQVNTYMAMSGDTAAYLLYENKDNQRFVGPSSSFRVDFRQDLWERTERYCRSRLIMLRRKDIPPVDEKVCKAYRRGCPYTEVCDQHRDGDLLFDDVDKRSPDLKQKHRLPLLYR